MIDQAERERLLAYLNSRFMLTVPETNLCSLLIFVEQRLDESGQSFDNYMQSLGYDHSEQALLIDASTIKETYFFRDASQFSLMERVILPFFSSVVERIPYVWSAACSTGEEAVSLALLLSGYFGGLKAIDGKVWASDINPLTLDTFAKGKFRTSALREDGSAWHGLVHACAQYGDQELTLSPDLIAAIRRLNLNLMMDSYDALPGPMDVIFLRNMMIYFPFDKRHIVYKKIADRLSNDGVLIVGKAELPFFQEERLTLIEREGCFFFIRKGSRFDRQGAVKVGYGK